MQTITAPSTSKACKVPRDIRTRINRETYALGQNLARDVRNELMRRAAAAVADGATVLELHSIVDVIDVAEVVMP
jgi:hypothetical protein